MIAFSQSAEMAKRMPVRPEQSASAVTALGARARSGIPGRRRRSESMPRPRRFMRADALEPLGLPDAPDDRLARDGALAERHRRAGPAGR